MTWQPLTAAISIEGRFLIEAYAPTRLYPVPLFEYVNARGGRLEVPYDISARLERDGMLAGYVRTRTIGPKVDESEWFNLVTNEGLAGIAKMLIDSSAAYDTGIKRLEIGTGGGSAITPTVDDTTLVGGQVRYATNAPTQSAGVITVVTAAGGGTSNIFIREMGLFFANDTATISAGDLLDHSAASHDNTSAAANLTITGVFALARKTSS